MDAIIKYIKEKYHPLALIVYGSFADGSNNQDSDFDALAVVPSGEVFHDASRVEGLQLDLFVYPAGHFGQGFDWNEIVQIFDGKILLDTGGLAQRLKDGARDYIAKLPRQSREESAQNIAWCRKMLLRAHRGTRRACSAGTGCWLTAWKFSAGSWASPISGRKKPSGGWRRSIRRLSSAIPRRLPGWMGRLYRAGLIIWKAAWIDMSKKEEPLKGSSFD